MIQFTTKAETLEKLEPVLASARVLPQIRLTVGEYREVPDVPVNLARGAKWMDRPLIVRSSARNEDTADSSNAGKFLSIGNVRGGDALAGALAQVADAMGSDPDNQIFIQPYLERVELCGVAFTVDPSTGGNYYILNYDDKTGSTSSVTDGSGTDLKMYCHFKGTDIPAPAPLDRVIVLCRELEALMGCPSLDLEFAFSDGMLYLLQVRPLVLRCAVADLEAQKRHLTQIQDKIRSSMQPHPDLCGERTIYGVMPDWNPAEMIGIHPRALALSLYKEIITDGVWAYQRDNYGYRNLRSFPLMLDFCGLPYIDTRVSFNSFLPKSLSEPLAQKLVEYYLEQLRQHPEKHDKVEFEIAFTCYTFDLPQRLEALKAHGFSQAERTELADALRDLTNSIICKDMGLWQKDAEKIRILREKHRAIMDSGLKTEEKIYWLLEYCKRYGTLPFAGLARAGFIAVEFLRSMVREGILTEEERTQYMNGLSTVGKNISRDFGRMEEDVFLKEYGHLRPGTYDICSARYDHSEAQYFDFSNQHLSQSDETPFKLSLQQFSSLQHMLERHQLKADVLSLFDYIQKAIEGREYAKFVFTHTLSDVLELLAELGEQYGVSREEMSRVTIWRIMKAYSSADDLKRVLESSIREGHEMEAASSAILLPPLIWDADQIFSFFQPDGEPNYITQKTCAAPVVCLPSEEDINGKIVFIQSADPGFDWIFSHKIAGFITAYGGANSHMAIRSAEFGIPAVIGIGEKAFRQYSKAKNLSIDCRNRKVAVLS